MEFNRRAQGIPARGGLQTGRPSVATTRFSSLPLRSPQTQFHPGLDAPTAKTANCPGARAPRKDSVPQERDRPGDPEIAFEEDVEEVQANQWPHRERFFMPAALLDEPKVNVQAEPKSTNFLGTERALLERFMPGLDAELKAIPLAVLEGRENPSIRDVQGGQGPRPLDPEALWRPRRDGRGGRTDPAGHRQPGTLAGNRLHDAQFLGLHPRRVGHVRRGVRRVPPRRPGREFDVSRFRIRGRPLRVQAARHVHAGPARSGGRVVAERAQEALHSDLFDGLSELRPERRDRGPASAVAPSAWCRPIRRGSNAGRSGRATSSRARRATR